MIGAIQEKCSEHKWLLTICVLALLLSVLAGSTHDYGLYQDHWADVIQGKDPWGIQSDEYSQFKGSAYGPLHVVFALPWSVNFLLPKILFAVLTCATLLLLLKQSAHADTAKTVFRNWELALVVSVFPLFAVSVLVLGNNDIVPAFCLLVSCILMADNRRIGAGAWIGVGALLKFYPLVFVGFLIARRSGTFDFRPLWSALAVFTAGMAVSYAIWGESVFVPVLYAAERGAKMLSILKYVDSIEGFRESAIVTHLLDKNSIYVMMAATLVALHGWLARLGWELTLLLGVLAVFSVYKVGHPQFFISWVTILTWILIRRPNDKAWCVAWNFLPVAALISLFQIIYLLSKILTDNYLGGDWAILRVYISPVYWGLLLVCLWRSRHYIFQRWSFPGLRQAFRGD